MWPFTKSSEENPSRVEGQEPVGTVTHFFGGISVAIVKFTKPVSVGIKVHFKGATTDFVETIRSMQYDHQDITTAKKGQEVGIKVAEKVREGDQVFEAA